MQRILLTLRLTAVLVLLLALSAESAVRLKDVATIQGVRRNQLIGYGLVVGLNGTGDKTGTEFTTQTTANLLERFGVVVNKNDVRLKNVAAVMVTAELPPFARAGQRIDVTVSSMGDAKSLEGGTLLLSPLRAANGDVFGVAQGAVSIGGFGSSEAGSSVQVNFPTVGGIPGGGILERDAPLPDLAGGRVELILNDPDFTTAARLARAIDERFTPGTARAVDGGRVEVTVGDESFADPVGFLAELEGVTVEPDAVARVVVNEKTGTVVLGENVTIRPVAIAHGNLTVQVTPYLEASQPEAFARGRTVARDRADVSASEETAHLVLLENGTNLSNLVRALNSLGVGPRELVAIFRTLSAAGALEADLEIM